MVVHSEKEAHVVRLTQQLELLVAHPERVGQIVRTPVNVVFTCNMSLSYGSNPVSASVSDKLEHFPSEDLSHFGAKKKSNNNIKCGKLFVGYSTVNPIINYTTTGK